LKTATVVENHVISGLPASVLVVFLVRMASLVPLGYQVPLGRQVPLGHQAVTDVMAVTDPKGLDPKDPPVPWVMLERMVLKENLESRVPPVKKASVEGVDSLGLQV